MWIAREDLEWLRSRIADLEGQLERERKSAVTRLDTREVVLFARIKELERQLTHCTNMLLRRAQSFPIPAESAKPDEPKQQTRPQVSPEIVAKARAAVDEGRRLKLSKDKIADGVLQVSGMSQEEIEKSIEALL